jgi:hypothetical protein
MIGRIGLGMILIVAAAGDARAQAVELFAAHQAATADVLFVNSFANPSGQATPWLLFHRSRAVVDYDLDADARRDLPQFGMTNAVSLNPKAWRGIGPVAAVSITTSNVAAKIGAQYARVGPRTTIFGWAVVETTAHPAADLFLLARHLRPVSPTIGMFTQVESLTVLAPAGKASSLTLRGRIGVAVANWQAGIGTDLRRSSGSGAATTSTVGVFLRHAF